MDQTNDFAVTVVEILLTSGFLFIITWFLCYINEECDLFIKNNKVLLFISTIITYLLVKLSQFMTSKVMPHLNM